MLTKGSREVETIRKKISSVFLLVPLIFSGLANATSQYNLIQLDNLSPLGYSSSSPFSINNLGQAVGGSVGPSLQFSPVLWNLHGNIQDLGFIETEYSMFGVSGLAMSINDHGVVVGNSGNRSFIWDQTNGIKEVKFINATDISSEALAIDNSGTVLGRVNGNQYYFWDHNSGFKLLNTSSLLEGTSINLSSINNNGIVVGSISSSGDQQTYAAIGTQEDGMTKLFDLPNLLTSSATSINNKGQVVGSYTLGVGESAFYSRPFLWDPIRGLIDLNIPEEFIASPMSVMSINNAGTILGMIAGSSVHGFLWDSVNGFRLMNSIIDNANKPENLDLYGLLIPVDINDRGQILISSSMDGRGYILSPVTAVPEPEKVGMFLVGLGLFSIIKRRRKFYS